MRKKEINKNKLLEYLGNPENEWLPRSALALTVLGYKNHVSLYRLFTTAELREIEDEAWESRKSKTHRQRANLYRALYEAGLAGDVAAIREFLNRTEGKVPDNVNNNLNHSMPEASVLTLRDIIAGARRKEVGDS